MLLATYSTAMQFIYIVNLRKIYNLPTDNNMCENHKRYSVHITCIMLTVFLNYGLVSE